MVQLLRFWKFLWKVLLAVISELRKRLMNFLRKFKEGWQTSSHGITKGLNIHQQTILNELDKSWLQKSSMSGCHTSRRERIESIVISRLYRNTSSFLKRSMTDDDKWVTHKNNVQVKNIEKRRHSTICSKFKLIPKRRWCYMIGAIGRESRVMSSCCLTKRLIRQNETINN